MVREISCRRQRTTQQLRETSGAGHAGHLSCFVREPAQAGLSSRGGSWPARGRAGSEPWEMHWWQHGRAVG